MKKAIVCGAGGFIGGHLVKYLKARGYWVRAADLKEHEYTKVPADEFLVGDLRDQDFCKRVFNVNGPVDRVYQLAADMGGAGFIFTGEHDADIMHNSALINLNVLTCIKDNLKHYKNTHIFYSSSACIYPEYNQTDAQKPVCREDTAYPAAPDSEYGWEKIFSERMYAAFARNYGLRIRIARFHNIFGPEGTWTGGREKAPAAICRKVAEAKDGGTVEVWGDGEQTRSFLYIDECLEGVERLMKSDFMGPVNIGSEEMVSINQLVAIAASVAGKTIHRKHIKGPLGVRGRNSDNTLIRQKLGWAPQQPLIEGIAKTFTWIESQIKAHGKGVGAHAHPLDVKATKRAIASSSSKKAKAKTKANKKPLRPSTKKK